MPGDPAVVARLAVADVVRQGERFDKDELPDLRQKFLNLKNRVDDLEALVGRIETRLANAGIL